MRYNHFSMLPENAFKPRAFGGMTLEGGGGGGGGDGGASRIAELEAQLQKLEQEKKEREAKEAALLQRPEGYTPISAEQFAYSQANRPGYREFGPSGQFQQPIYQSSYEGYAAPPTFYSPGYSLGNLYNPFMDYLLPTYDQIMKGVDQVNANRGAGAASEAGKAGGGAIQSQGIDALLK